MNIKAVDIWGPDGISSSLSLHFTLMVYNISFYCLESQDYAHLHAGALESRS